MTNYTELVEQLKSGKSTYLDRQAVTAIEALVAERDALRAKVSKLDVLLSAKQFVDGAPESLMQSALLKALKEAAALRAELDAIKSQSGPEYEDGPDSDGFRGPRPWNGFQTTPQPAPEKLAVEPVAIHQYRSPHCSDWYDGIPDHHDGHGPYEVRTLFTAPTPPKLTEWDIRGMLASKLKCWHRLSEEEAAELVALYEAHPPVRHAQYKDAEIAKLRESICEAIKAEDDYCVTHGDYMLDSDDCIAVVRGTWKRPDFAIDAARSKQ